MTARVTATGLDDTVGVMAGKRSGSRASSIADGDAFAAFYRRHENTLLRYFARQIYDPQLALDLTAESFAQAFMGRARFRDASRPALSGRERQVLTGLARGESGDELARRLVIAPETVRRHVANAREKLGARSRVHAVALALHRGEIEPELEPGPALRDAASPPARPSSAGV